MEAKPPKLSTDDRLFEDFENVRIDPFISDIFKKVAIYNQLLQEQFVDSTQINEIMNELDAEWQGLLGEKAIVTGLLSFVPEEFEGENGPREKLFYENQDIVFGGVLPVQVEGGYPLEDDESLHQYELRILVKREGIRLNGTYLEMRGNATVEDIVSLEFENSISLMRAQKWLEYYHREDVEDIDAALLNSSSGESEMVMGLEGIVIDAHSVHKNDESHIQRSSQALNAYTNSLFSFDAQFPYRLRARGETWIYIDGEAKPADIEEEFESPVVIHGLLWLSSADETVLHAHLDLTLLADSIDTELPHLFVPLSSILTLGSLRREYFEASDQKDE